MVLISVAAVMTPGLMKFANYPLRSDIVSSYMLLVCVWNTVGNLLMGCKVKSTNLHIGCTSKLFSDFALFEHGHHLAPVLSVDQSSNAKQAIDEVGASGIVAG